MWRTSSVCSVIFFLLIFWTSVSTEEDMNISDRETGKITGKVTGFNMYKRLFEQNRAIQLDAVKSIQKFGTKYEQRYKLVDTMLQRLFLVVDEAKVNLTEWGFTPGDPFPENETIRESMSKVLENTAMFGDLVLRLPDIVHSIYDRKKEWQITMTWAVWFANESGIFAGANAKLLHLMSQEINLIPQEENYQNPFREEEILKSGTEEETKETKKKQKQKKKKEKDKKKGPRLSGGTHHTEL